MPVLKKWKIYFYSQTSHETDCSHIATLIPCLCEKVSWILVRHHLFYGGEKDILWWFIDFTWKIVRDSFFFDHIHIDHYPIALLKNYPDCNTYCTVTPNVVQLHPILYSYTQHCTVTANIIQLHQILYSYNQYCTVTPNIVQLHPILYDYTQYCTVKPNIVQLNPMHKVEHSLHCLTQCTMNNTLPSHFTGLVSDVAH